MRRQGKATLGAVLAAGLTLAATAGAPATARTKGTESFKATIVASNPSGTRTVLSSTVFVSGVFTAVGRIREVDNRPGDPDDVNRDDVVFRRGTLHFRNTSQPPSISLDPQTCVATIRIEQTTQIQGGTRRFRHASGTLAGTLHGWGVAARNPDGSCSQELPSLLEVAVLSSRGTISY
jgi:hypothetical protein